MKAKNILAGGSGRKVMYFFIWDCFSYKRL